MATLTDPVAPLVMGTAKARWVLLTTVLGSSLAMLDATVVNVALERIGADLDAGFAGLQWTINGYTLTLAALILLGGSLGDRLGRRRVFLIGVVWFALASALCGFAPNIGTLIAARALQGVGGALLTPGSLAIISASFAGKDRAAAVGAWSGLGGIAGAIGPFVGGWLVEWNWRAVFLINLPLAALVIAVAMKHVPESRDPEASPHLDVVGTVLAVTGLGGITYALTASGGAGAGPLRLVLGIAGAAALVAFVWAERRSTHPLVPPDLFKNRQFSAANAVTFVVYAALGTLFLLLVLQLQIVAGFSALLAGVALLPVTLIMLLFSARAGRLAQRIGPRLPMSLGPLVSAGGILLMLRINADASYWWDVLPAVIAFAAGLALTVAPLTATVLDSADDHRAGIASGVNNAVARAAGLLAVAIIPGLAGITGDAYNDPGAFGSGFHTALFLMAGLLLLGALLAVVFIRQPMRAADPPAADPPAEGPPAGPGPVVPATAAARRLRVEDHLHCGVCGPNLHPRDPHPPAPDPRDRPPVVATGA